MKTQPSSAPSSKVPDEMSIAELEEEIKKLEGEIETIKQLGLSKETKRELIDSHENKIQNIRWLIEEKKLSKYGAKILEALETEVDEIRVETKALVAKGIRRALMAPISFEMRSMRLDEICELRHIKNKLNKYGRRIITVGDAFDLERNDWGDKCLTNQTLGRIAKGMKDAGIPKEAIEDGFLRNALLGNFGVYIWRENEETKGAPEVGSEPASGEEWGDPKYLKGIPEELLRRSVETLTFRNNRAIHVLYLLNIQTVREILLRSKEKWRQTRSCGPKTLHDMREELREIGIPESALQEMYI